MSYHRTRGGFESFTTGDYTQVNTIKRKNASDLVTTTQVGNVIMPDVGKVMTDVVTPRFRELKSKGVIINNPMSRVSQHVNVVPYSGTSDIYTNKRTTVSNGATLSSTNTWSNLVVDPSNPAFPNLGEPYDFSRLEQDVVNKAFNKSHQQDVMGIVDAAEIGQTAELLIKALGTMEAVIRRDVNMLHKMKAWKQRTAMRKKFTKDGKLSFKYYSESAKGKAADASNLFLEYTYGVKPLMDTVEGLLKQLVEITKPIRSTYRSNDEKQINDEAEKILTYTNYGVTVPHLKFRRKRTIDWSVRAGVITEFRPTLTDRLGLNLHSLPSAGYELIPFSFVLDWIWGLGPAIEALTPHPSYRALASWSVLERSIHDEYHITWLSGTCENSTDKIVLLPGNASTVIDSHVIQRTPGVSPGIPNAKLNFSHFTHLLNGLALTLSSVKRTSLARL